MPKIMLYKVFIVGCLGFSSQFAFANWMAVAMGANSSWSAVTQMDTQQQAETYVLKECEKKAQQPCHLEFSSDKNLRLMVASNGTFTSYAVGKNRDSVYEATKNACNQHRGLFGKKCEMKFIGGNGTAAPKVFIGKRQIATN